MDGRRGSSVPGRKNNGSTGFGPKRSSPREPGSSSAPSPPRRPEPRKTPSRAGALPCSPTLPPDAAIRTSPSSSRKSTRTILSGPPAGKPTVADSSPPTTIAPAGLALLLAPLRPFRNPFRRRHHVQAISGAGRRNLAAMDIAGNCVPFIRGEEEKLAREPGRIFRDPRGGRFRFLGPSRCGRAAAASRFARDTFTKRLRQNSGSRRRGRRGRNPGLLPTFPRRWACPRRRSGRSSSGPKTTGPGRRTSGRELRRGPGEWP